MIKPFWQTTDEKTVRLYQGNVVDVLDKLPSQSVHMVVTSPPYWGLRDYGTDKTKEIGSEKTPEEFVEKMVEVFSKVKRVLRDDGTLWLNLGDSYAAKIYQEKRTEKTVSKKVIGKDGVYQRRVKRQSSKGNFRIKTDCKLKAGNLVGAPWRVALALQNDGWILRQDIIWAKPNPMPESVRSRCTKSHEYIFLLTKKSSGYFYDADAIREGDKVFTRKAGGYKKHSEQMIGGYEPFKGKGGFADSDITTIGRNKRSVWNVSTEAYSGSHFATFPQKLILPCILAGTSEKGCCLKCKAPWERIVKVEGIETRPDKTSKYGNASEDIRGGSETLRKRVINTVDTIGWEPTCNCKTKKTIPCTVLDPFIGSGTSCCVAFDNGRHSIGIDLNEKYLKEQAIKRISDHVCNTKNGDRLIKKRERIKIGKKLKGKK